MKAALEMKQVPRTGNERLDAQLKADLWDRVEDGHTNPALVLRQGEEPGDSAIEIGERKLQILRLYAALQGLPVEEQAKAVTPPGGNVTLLQPRQQDEPAQPVAPAGMLQRFQQQAPQNPQHVWNGAAGPEAGVYAPQPPAMQQHGGIDEGFFLDTFPDQPGVGRGPGGYANPAFGTGRADLLRPQQYP